MTMTVTAPATHLSISLPPSSTSKASSPLPPAPRKSDSIARSLLRRHPLQKLESPSRGSSALLHAVGLASFAYSFSSLIYSENPVNKSYGWHLQYLTIIGLSLAALTFLVGFVADMTLSPLIFRIKNTLSVGSAPMECLITVLYWSLYMVDKSLVQSEWTPDLGILVDMSFHLVPAVCLVTDLLLFSPPYTIVFAPAMTLSTVIAFGYWFWIERCYSFNKFYPYPIFEMLNTPQRIGLFASSALLMTLSTTALIWLYGLVNGRLRYETVGEPRKGRSGNVKGE